MMTDENGANSSETEKRQLSKDEISITVNLAKAKVLARITVFTNLFAVVIVILIASAVSMISVSRIGAPPPEERALIR
jgi:hypothetical protein